MTPAAQSPATPTTNYVDERLLDAKLQAVEARTETKFVQLLSKLDSLADQIKPLSGEIAEAKNAAASAKTYIIGTGIAIGGFIIALFAFGWQILDAAIALAEL